MVFKSKKSSSSSTKPIRWLPKRDEIVVVPSNDDDIDSTASSCSSTFFVASPPDSKMKTQPLHQQQGGTQKPKKSVTFKESSRIRLVVKAKDLVECKSELWYQHDEFQRINSKASAIIKAVDNDSYKSKKAGSRLCVRGLEKFLKVNKHHTMAIRKQATNDVLDEQAFQQKHLSQNQKKRSSSSSSSSSYNGVEAIAYAYNESSSIARKDAIKRGMNDEKEAMKIHSNNSQKLN